MTIKEHTIKVTMYGIANCDTIKKAKKWLDSHSIEYHFHDYKKRGIDESTVTNAIQQFGIDTVVNKRGTTYRKLSDEEKSTLDGSNVISLLSANTSMIKRPILTADEHILVGFNANDYAALFNVE